MTAEGQPSEVAIAASVPAAPVAETAPRAMPWPVPMPMETPIPEVAMTVTAEPLAVAVESAPVVEAPVEPAPVVVAPVAAPTEPEVAVAVQPEPAIPVPAVDLTANLEQAGLVMIETAATRIQSAMPIEPAKPQLGRKPKAPVVVPDEPLQMVETRHD